MAGLTPSVAGDSDVFTESAPELSTPASGSKDEHTQSPFIANSNKCDENNILNPCFHTLFTSVEPQLTTPVFVKSEHTSLSNRHSCSDVFALHSGEAFISSSSPGEDDALQQDVFITCVDDELPGHSQHD